MDPVAGSLARMRPAPTRLGRMTDSTQEQVMDAIRSLGSDEFTRDDVAKKLGVEISAMQPGWKAAKEAGQIKKVPSDDGERTFRISSE